MKPSEQYFKLSRKEEKIKLQIQELKSKLGLKTLELEDICREKEAFEKRNYEVMAK